MAQREIHAWLHQLQHARGAQGMPLESAGARSVCAPWRAACARHDLFSAVAGRALCARAWLSAGGQAECQRLFARQLFPGQHPRRIMARHFAGKGVVAGHGHRAIPGRRKLPRAVHRREVALGHPALSAVCRRQRRRHNLRADRPRKPRPRRDETAPGDLPDSQKRGGHRALKKTKTHVGGGAGGRRAR